MPREKVESETVTRRPADDDSKVFLACCIGWVGGLCDDGCVCGRFGILRGLRPRAGHVFGCDRCAFSFGYVECGGCARCGHVLGCYGWVPVHASLRCGGGVCQPR